MLEKSLAFCCQQLVALPLQYHPIILPAFCLHLRWKQTVKVLPKVATCCSKIAIFTQHSVPKQLCMHVSCRYWHFPTYYMPECVLNANSTTAEATTV